MAASIVWMGKLSLRDGPETEVVGEGNVGAGQQQVRGSSELLSPTAQQPGCRSTHGR